MFKRSFGVLARGSNLMSNPNHTYLHLIQSIIRRHLVSTFLQDFTSGSDDKAGISNSQEVKIPTPWGHISGKWWGSSEVTPLIGLHGLQDNAGSFDRIAPLLDVPAFLALDAPGHGHSSHFPLGMGYSFLDFVISLRRVILHFGWKKVSILGHSFGSAIGFVYSALYPDEVHCFISMECARALMANDDSNGLHRFKNIMEKTLKFSTLQRTDPPAYTSEEIFSAFMKAYSSSITKENAIYILNRGIHPHPKTAGAFYFARDPMVRNLDFCRPNFELQAQYAECMKCHIMTIFGKEGFIVNHKNPAIPHQYLTQEKIMMKSAASFVRHDLPGTHHLHLNNPEIVASAVNSFLRILPDPESKIF